MVMFAPASAVAAAEAPASPVNTAQLVETGVGLAIVLALIVGLAWLARRFGRAPLKGGGQVQVLGGVSLGPRERAVLLEIEGARLLVGVAPGQVRTLHVTPRDDAAGSVEFPDVLKQQAQGVN